MRAPARSMFLARNLSHTAPVRMHLKVMHKLVQLLHFAVQLVQPLPLRVGQTLDRPVRLVPVGHDVPGNPHNRRVRRHARHDHAPREGVRTFTPRWRNSPLTDERMATLLPARSLPDGPLDFATAFGRVGPVVLEIGSGHGAAAIAYCAATGDLDCLDYADLRFLDHSTEYFVHEYLVTDLPKARAALETNPFLGRWVATARGCKYECSYCGGCKSAHKVLANRDGIVPRSPEAVVDELERLASGGGVGARAADLRAGGAERGS